MNLILQIVPTEQLIGWQAELLTSPDLKGNLATSRKADIPMDAPATSRQCVRFGAFELDLRSEELRKHGNKASSRDSR